MFTYELKIWKSFTLDLLNSQKSLRILLQNFDFHH